MKDDEVERAKDRLRRAIEQWDKIDWHKTPSLVGTAGEVMRHNALDLLTALSVNAPDPS